MKRMLSLLLTLVLLATSFPLTVFAEEEATPVETAQQEAQVTETPQETQAAEETQAPETVQTETPQEPEQPAAEQETAAAEATETPVPTETPIPTETPAPTETPIPVEEQQRELPAILMQIEDKGFAYVKTAGDGVKLYADAWMEQSIRNMLA